MKIALAQINPIIGDFKGNIAKIVDFAEKAREKSCDLVVFPELAVCGYPPKDFLERNSFLQACQDSLEKIMKSVNGIAVILGTVEKIPESKGKSLGNAVLLFEDGNLLHKAHKRLLPTYDVFDETRYFAPGDSADVFSFKGLKLGLTVCEDAWNDQDFFPAQTYDWDPVQSLASAGANIIINIAASPFHEGKRDYRGRMMSHIAKKHGVHFIYVNQTGGADHVLFDGASSVHGPKGDLAARACEFEEDMIVYDAASGVGDMHSVSESNAEAVENALAMGVGDYVRKCGFSKVVVGLSGGIDSALTLAIAAKALGPENALAVFMPSDYTDSQNFTDTKELCKNLGCPYEVVPIAPVFERFLSSLSSFCDRERHGITEQNLQARIRGTILMAYSNNSGAMVLSTGNKSESAVGYCTLYGDMNGGLSVISDLPKALVYEVSRSINRNGEIIPASIIDKAPSAELKPDQKDQDDLPEYEVLDPILHAYLEEFKDPDEIVAMGYKPEVVNDIIRRVMRNEYKRRQAAPGLRITAKAFGEGRRYPVAQRFKDEAS